MSENPLQALCHNMEKLSNAIQTHFSNLMGRRPHDGKYNPYIHDKRPLFSISSSSKPTSLASADSTKNQQTAVLSQEHSTAPVTKEELGRATWTFLHTLAAQYPDNPTRQQKKDVKDLMMILSRMYPCQECADHFKEILRANPVQVGSHAEFSQWLCHVHNVVNRSLGKKVFPCERVDARWGKLECEQRACDVQGTLTKL